jgi:hypothetical protein
MELKKPISLERFITLVESIALMQRKSKWKILCLLTDLDIFSGLEKRLKDFSFDFKRIGDILEISKEFKNPKYIFKAYLFQYQNLLFFTSNERIDDIDSLFISDFLKKVKNIYYMWIPKRIIEDLIEDFKKKYRQFLIKEFHAERDSIDHFKAFFRQEIDRKMTYSGLDGLEVLKEHKYYYGVRPYLVDINIIDLCSFRINKNGYFIYDSGDLTFLLNIIQELYNKLKYILDPTMKTHYYEETLKEINIPILNVQPLIAKLKNFELDTDNIEVFNEILRESGFEIFNQIVIEGSINFNCDIIDTEKRAIFNVSSGGKELIITPQYDTTFDTIFSFIELLSDKVDSEIALSLYQHLYTIEEEV